jgi:Protein of unknown function (DUF2844)
MSITSLFRRVAAGAALSVLISVLLPASSAHAELGAMMAAIQPGSQGVAGASAPVTLLNGAVLRRTSIDAGGTTVREYASNTGQVFAYTWQGPSMPDLPGLLGPYNASYRAGAAAAASGGRDLHASRVAQPDVVVESGGQMRSYVGRAWLPAALPAGVTPDELH